MIALHRGRECPQRFYCNDSKARFTGIFDHLRLAWPPLSWDAVLVGRRLNPEVSTETAFNPIGRPWRYSYRGLLALVLKLGACTASATIDRLSSDAGQPNPDSAVVDSSVGWFINPVATLYTEQHPNGDRLCATASTARVVLGQRAEHFSLWDASELPFARCSSDGRVVCERQSVAVLSAAATYADGTVARFWSCVADAQPTAAVPVAALRETWDRTGGDSHCRRAGDPESNKWGLWDSGRPAYGSCQDGHVSCQKGSRRLVTAMRITADDRVEAFVSCLLHGQALATNVVATFYSEVRDGVSVCLDQSDSVARAVGYWDDGPSGFAQCGDDSTGIGKCTEGTRRIIEAALTLPSGGFKYHNTCVRADQRNSTRVVARIVTHSNTPVGATCASTPAGYWDLAKYGGCRGDNFPQCLEGSKATLAAMHTLAQGVEEYQTHCLLEDSNRQDENVDRVLRSTLRGKVYGWWTHGFYTDHLGLFVRFPGERLPEHRFPDSPAPICEIGSYTNFGLARSPEDIARLVACGNYKTIGFGLNAHPLVAQMTLTSADPGFRDAFFATFAEYLDQLHSLLSGRNLIDAVDLWYIADEPALHRDIYIDQAFLDTYARLFRRKFTQGKVAMAFAEDRAGDGSRGAHYAPPPDVDIVIVDPYFWHNEHPCDSASLRRYLYSENENSTLDWAFQWDREVYLAGWAVSIGGKPPRDCYLEETFRVFQQDERIDGLVWFIYDAPFREGILAGAANDNALVAKVRDLALGRSTPGG